MKRNIILIGFMGTGKTTVGQLLSDKLGHTFVDTDGLIVEAAGMTIPELFEHKGEPYFRDLESEMLEKALQREGLVLATGGGAVLRERNRNSMLEGGFVVALKAGAEHIIDRVKHDANRPLLAGDAEARVRKLLQDRAEAYDFAHLSIRTDELAPHEAAGKIAEAWTSAQR